MSKYIYLFLGLFLYGACLSESEKAPKKIKQPNILWLVAEDLSAIIPPFGDSTVQTPNLSRLAAEGVRYPNVFSPAGVCAPSRAAICTGMYPTSIGAHNMRTQYNRGIMDQLGMQLYEVVPPAEVRMMSEILRSNGYYCTNNDKTDYQFAPSPLAWDESSPYAHWRHRDAEQPFFAIFNFGITHESQVFGTYGQRHLRYQPGFPASKETNPVPGWGVNVDSSDWDLLVPADLDVPVPPYLPDTEAAKNDIRRVYSNVVKLDEQIGLIIQQLEEDGLLEETIIVWYTDHGGPLPRQKRLLYDSGIQVPMIIRFPEKAGAGTIDEQLISFIDLAPTTFSLTGIKPPTYLQGQAFLGTYSADQPRSHVFAASDRLDTEIDRIRVARNQQFKYIRNDYPERPYYLPIAYRERMYIMQELLRLRDVGQLSPAQAQWFRERKPKEELFDLTNDPHELNNLADDPAYADQLAALRSACTAWLAETGDLGDVPEKELIERFWPGGMQPQTAAPEMTLNDKTGAIQLSCSTPGASLGYQWTNNNDTQPTAWTVYSKPIKRPATTTKMRLIAHRLGYQSSEVVEIEF